MESSRELSVLKTPIRTKAKELLEEGKRQNLDILIYCTYRTNEEQARIYRRGRSFMQIKQKADELSDTWKRPDLAELLIAVGAQFGKKATYAGPGQSLHNYCYAFDAVPVVDGKLLWSKKHPEWQTYGRLAVKVELEWAGHWRRFVEYPHVQLREVRWQDLINS